MNNLPRNPYQSNYFNQQMAMNNTMFGQNQQMDINTQSSVIPTIKGKYINSIDDVINFQSNDVDPAICVDLLSGKIYLKTFNIDGSYKIEEFIKNENAQIDTRSQAEKLNDIVMQLATNVGDITNELNSIKTELGIGGNKYE